MTDTIKSLIDSLRAETQQNAVTPERVGYILQQIYDAVAKMDSSVDTLVNGNVTEAIENFNEVINFLAGIKDNENLSKTLTQLRSDIDTLSTSKADKAATLADYGITDAYTKQEADTLLEGKADKAATLAGYGITDAYTKAEVDALIRTIQGAITEDATESDIDKIINQL